MLRDLPCSYLAAIKKRVCRSLCSHPAESMSARSSLPKKMFRHSGLQRGSNLERDRLDLTGFIIDSQQFCLLIFSAFYRAQQNNMHVERESEKYIETLRIYPNIWAMWEDCLAHTIILCRVF